MRTFHGFQFDSWWKLVAPAKTPGDIIIKLNDQLLQIVKQPEVRGITPQE